MPIQVVNQLGVLEDFYEQCALARPFACHLFYRTKVGNLGFYEQGRLTGHLCLSFRQPWPLILGAAKMRWPIFRVKEKNLRRCGVLRSLEISNVVVHPERRNQGVATRLLEYGLSLARATERMVDLLVRRDREDLVAWYERLGFTAVIPVRHKIRMRLVF